MLEDFLNKTKIFYDWCIITWSSYALMFGSESPYLKYMSKYLYPIFFFGILTPIEHQVLILYFISFPIYLSGSNANFFVYFGKNWFFLLKQSPWFLLSRGIITYHHKHGKIKVMYYREKKRKKSKKKILKIIVELRLLIVIGVEVQAW